MQMNLYINFLKNVEYNWFKIMNQKQQIDKNYLNY